MLAEFLVNILIEKYSICFPFKKQPARSDKHWVDTEAHNLKYLLYDLLYLKKRFPFNKEIISKCEEYSNQYNHMLKEKRLRFYSDLIRKNSNKSKCMWKIVNTELGRGNHDRVDYTDLVQNKSQPFTTKQDLVDALNLEFVTAASKCGAPIANSPRAVAALDSHAPASDVSLRLRPFTPFEVYTIATKYVAPKNSTDIYGLSASLIKTAINPLACIISYMFNLCLREGVYPKALKKAHSIRVKAKKLTSRRTALYHLSLLLVSCSKLVSTKGSLVL